MLRYFKNLTNRFETDKKGGVAAIFALTSLPVVLLSGVAIDYGTATRAAAKVQVAVDSAALQAASRSSNREAIAAAVYSAALNGKFPNGSPTASGADANGKGYKVTGSVTVDTMVLRLAGIKKITVTRSAVATYATTAVAGVTDNSCVFTFGDGVVGDDATTFNGSPSVNMSGCSLRSNASIKCNGHNTNADASIAVGSITGCDNAQQGTALPDSYAAQASNINKKCGNSGGGVSWNASGAAPSASSSFIVEDKGTHKQINVCGDLNLSGTGDIAASFGKDVVLIVENGQINMGDNANITATGTAMVLAGGNGSDPVIDFPNGSGKAATLNVSAGSNASNPWKGYGIYQDPALTDDVDMSFGPGANLVIGGIAYFPNAKISVSGNMSTGGTGCTKIVSREFTLNGNVNLSLSQSTAACDALGVTQYTTPGTPATYSYLAE